MAMVFQDYAIYPHMSVIDNIGFGLKMRKMSKTDIARRVGEATEILNISHLLMRRPHELSGGERQRVALGRAIVRRPKVFLFDEPLANLDAALRTQMRGELSRLHKELGTTFVYVTHDQIEAMTMATKISVMDKGVLQQGEQEVTVPEDIKQLMFKNKLIGKPLALGIRPEHLLVGSLQAGGLLATFLYSENTGADVYMHFAVQGCYNHIIARVSTVKRYEEKTLGIHLDWENALLFNPEGTLIRF